MKAENLFELAVMMQRTAEGISLVDIQNHFSVSPRTADRMRDAIGRLFVQMEEVPTGERTKRWKLPAGIVNSLITFTADELAELKLAIKQSEQNNLHEQAKTLSSLYAKVEALQKDAAKRKTATDLEALSEAEGLAMRPGPRPKIDANVLNALRQAIKGCNEVQIKYKSRGTGLISTQRICPYGFLYGNRHYLIAFNLNPEVYSYRTFSLSNILEVLPTDKMFERREDFSLEEFAQRSFGVFEGPIYDVVWKFSPNAAEDAREFHFHPTQTMEEQEDGSLIVKFRAGGWWEMDCHLYTWGEEVEDLTDYGDEE